MSGFRAGTLSVTYREHCVSHGTVVTHRNRSRSCEAAFHEDHNTGIVEPLAQIHSSSVYIPVQRGRREAVRDHPRRLCVKRRPLMRRRLSSSVLFAIQFFGVFHTPFVNAPSAMRVASI